MRRRALLVLPVLSLLLIMPLDQASAASIGAWTATTSYPLQIAGESCVANSENVYCLGGFDSKGHDYDNAYLSSFSASGLGAWTPTTPYPFAVDSSSCVLSSAVIYCVGGENATSVTSAVYKAPITSSGIGAWTQAAAYPQTIAATSCFPYSGYIYCVGGFDITGDETASSYYASLSSGLSSWMGTTSYPFAVNSEACMVQANYVYCVAGNEESGLPQFPVSNVYYAELSPSGIGTWTATTQYPEALSSVSCVLYSGSVYCAGGFDLNQHSSAHVYTASVTTSGVSSWTNSTAYPSAFDVSSCVAYLSYMYCVAGRNFEGKLVTMTDDDYFASLGASATSTASSSTSATSSASSASSSNSTSSSSSTTSTSSSVPEFPSALLPPVLLSILAVATLISKRAGRKSPPSREHPSGS